MQNLKQFLHWFFIKNHDFVGLQISMDFCMVFSLKMASKSKPFSKKKTSKKQDVFRASQKSFFLRSWSAPGQCPMTVLIFLIRFFRFLAENGRQRGSQKVSPFGRFATQNAPKTLPNRICDGTSIFHGFCMDLGTHFHWFLVLWDAILDCFLCWFAVFAVSQIPTH